MIDFPERKSLPTSGEAAAEQRPAAEDLEKKIASKHVLIPPNRPGVTVAFIVENGAPIEFLQFERAASKD